MDGVYTGTLSVSSTRGLPAQLQLAFCPQEPQPQKGNSRKQAGHTLTCVLGLGFLETQPKDAWTSAQIQHAPTPSPHFHNAFQELLTVKCKAPIPTAPHHSGTVTEGLKPTREVEAEADATPADIMVTERPMLMPIQMPVKLAGTRVSQLTAVPYRGTAEQVTKCLEPAMVAHAFNLHSEGRDRQIPLTSKLAWSTQ